MKTAISMEDDLFEAVSELAEKSHRPRSQIVSEAVRDYLEKQKSLKALEAINRVYQVPESVSEQKRHRLSKRRYAARFMGRSW